MKYNDLSFGQAEAVFNKLGGMEGVKRFLSGETIIKERYLHNIDTDAKPAPIEIAPVYKYIVVKHKGCGIINFEAERVVTSLSVADGVTYRYKMLNANILDYLLKNTYLIPEEWKLNEDGKTQFIHFLGTEYHFLNNNEANQVRCLFYNKINECWDWEFRYVSEFNNVSAWITN